VTFETEKSCSSCLTAIKLIRRRKTVKVEKEETEIQEMFYILKLVFIIENDDENGP